jgi:hypothetical protein
MFHRQFMNLQQGLLLESNSFLFWECKAIRLTKQLLNFL